MRYYIYALIDPRSDTVEYVGMTRDFIQRYQQHLSCYGTNRQKDEWISELKNLRLLPSFKILETVEGRGVAIERERDWIKQYDSSRAPLLNMQRNKARSVCQVGVNQREDLDPDVVEDKGKKQANFIKKDFRNRVKHERKGLTWTDDKYTYVGIDWETEWERYKSSPATYRYEGEYVPQPRPVRYQF